ncbi:MAG: YIP1 family protein [Acidobacteria bacterium]|nr:YIP1 family protein [Acidobacteriota bacterium]MBU1339641.1 YIP1 family protein [Acidobacteriota bacterium]MBU1474156.1 YIP1 family protein [Acidobacteriota bacterium]MBU4204447.1 YIP1 family protein [Acidobacteriota bacterium]MBU4254491.1 YIP1 family protein [Acidobacteriota bacterium]
MDIVNRVQGIILKPKEEWAKIKSESTTIQQLFTSYALILAAIPAIANFIGMGLIGRRIPFIGWYRYDIGTAVLYAILSYVFSLVTVYIFGIIINALAPTFGSKSDAVNSMKLAVFSMTPFWVAGVFYLIPFLGVLALLAGLYGLYVLYLGFSHPLMDTPQDKVVGYLLVSIVVVAVLMGVVMMIMGAIFAVGGMGRVI